MNYFMFLGNRLRIARHANISPEMMPRGLYSEQVQIVLDETEKWSGEKGVIETIEFELPIAPITVPIDDAQVIWGIHTSHEANNPGLSPFVRVNPPSELLGCVTIELVGPWYDVHLTRAYGGDYTPPLPWMSSARKVDGGRAVCREYWRNHAYVDRSPTLIREMTETNKAPRWYLKTE